MRPDSSGRSQCPRIAKGHHPLPVLIPQREAHAGEAVPEIEPANLPQRGMIPQDLRKPIERNAARQVMHVMHADIAGEPTERRRQFVERAAVQGRLGLAPFPGCFPGGSLELMLNVKEPHPGRCAEGDNREVDAEKRREARDPDQEGGTKRMPALVVIVLSHGIEPLRMKPKGKRFSIRKR